MGKNPVGCTWSSDVCFTDRCVEIKQVLQTLNATCTRCEKPYMACSLEMPEEHEPEILKFKLIV